ncbi:MAG: permease [Flexilinea sp.]
MNFVIELFYSSLQKVLTSLLHNWPFLLFSVVIAVGIKIFVDPNKASNFLTKYNKAGVVGATLVAVLTPFCSCGTTAIILGMVASKIPWAPIIAFMVASPLTSPEELVYSAGLFGWPFALAFFVSSIILGLIGGLIGGILDQRKWLANQARFSDPEITRPERKAEESDSPFGSASCACGDQSNKFSGATSVNYPVDSRQGQPEAQKRPKVTLRLFLSEFFATGKRLLFMFVGFAFLGFFLNGLIPSAWVTAVFGSGNVYSVPLAAILGLPLYINTEGSLPLIRALIDGGMSQGAALAFLITGAGTSIGAFTGMLAIARWRVIITVVGILWIGAIIMGYIYNILMTTGLV